MVLMVLTAYLHPVDLGHLSGVTDETYRQGRNPVNIL
jgi:hypothetical protein